MSFQLEQLPRHSKMKPTEHKIRVLIADDHTTVLAGLASIIGMQPDMVVVAEAANGRKAVELWLKHRPEVTLLDLRMPMLDGVGVINEIRQKESAARFVILTTYDADNEIYRAIKSRSERLSPQGRATRGHAGVHP